jgi:hypothetical protein
LGFYYPAFDNAKDKEKKKEKRKQSHQRATEGLSRFLQKNTTRCEQLKH